MLKHLPERDHGEGLEHEVVDEEVGRGRQGGADEAGDAAGVVNDVVQLRENGAAQHGAHEDVEHVPQEEEGRDAAVHHA